MGDIPHLSLIVSNAAQRNRFFQDTNVNLLPRFHLQQSGIDPDQMYPITDRIKNCCHTKFKGIALTQISDGQVERGCGKCGCVDVENVDVQSPFVPKPP